MHRYFHVLNGQAILPTLPRRARRRRVPPPAANFCATVPEPAPRRMTPHAMNTLQQVISRLLMEELPDTEPGALPSRQIAEILEQDRAAGLHHGRHFGLEQPACGALATGLDFLDRTSISDYGFHFIELGYHLQENLLARVHRGLVVWIGLNAALWFDEVLADATTIYISNPEFMLRLSFDSFQALDA
jgi:hypothetical protein